MRMKEEEQLARSLGYICEPDARRGHGWSRFLKGNRTVWECSQGWATADLVEGRYWNQEYFPRLEEALNRPL